MSEFNKAAFRAIPEKLINTKTLEAADQYFGAEFVDHAAPPGSPAGIAGFKSFFGALTIAFPDLRYTVEDLIAEGEQVVGRMSVRGTMKGDFQGMKATGKTAFWTEIHIGRFANGKVVEHWATIDQLGMLQQLGLAHIPQQQVVAPSGIKN
jgi:predicted ester cyclase